MALCAIHEMAVIDTFLKLMVEKRAERLVLVSDKVPFLLKAGETIALSMPALRAEMLLRISQELAGPGGGAPAGWAEGFFEAADGTCTSIDTVGAMHGSDRIETMASALRSMYAIQGVWMPLSANSQLPHSAPAQRQQLE